MAATPSIKVLKSIPYRGATVTYSNRYHFNGGTPADNTHWTTLSDAIVTAEKAIHSPGATITGTVGYAAGSDVPVFSKAYSTAGTWTVGTNIVAAGDVAALVRYGTAARTSKNHPVYLFNYYHRAYSGSGGGDQLATTQQTAMQTYANAWISGFSDGTITVVRAGPNGATATGALVLNYLTHRDFPR